MGSSRERGAIVEQENPAHLHYKGEAGRVYHEGKRGIPPKALPWVSRLRAEKFSPYVNYADAVLEYGVGAGWNLMALNCKEKTGFDVSDNVQNMLDPSIKFVADIAILQPNSFDVVICHHTLEHLAEPFEALGEMKRLLKKDGRLWLSVPYEKERRYRAFDPREPNHHLYSWNVQSLGNLVRDAGFEIVECGLGRFGYDRFAARWACKLKLCERGFRSIRWLAHLFQPAFEVRMVAHPVWR